MSEYKYIVTLDRHEDYYRPNTNDVTEWLAVGLATLNNHDVTVMNVRKYDPEGEVRTGKITAIRRIRSLLQCSLKDAKFLADIAEAKGSAGWSTVTVEYDSTGFLVIDNS